jgi:hypothetical protein
MPANHPIYLTKFSRNLFLLCAGAAFGQTSAFAQAVQPWPDILVSAPLTKDWLVSGEVIGRIADDRRTSQLETRIQVGHVFSKSVTVWAGWVHFANYNPSAPNGREDQAVEQLNWNVGSIGRMRFSTRTRMEQRFVRGVDGASFRWRQQVRLAYALGHKGAPSLVLWTEPFVALNRTGAQRHTLDQLRTFVGVSLPISRKADFEIGYLNQRIYRPASEIVNHAIPISLAIRF